MIKIGDKVKIVNYEKPCDILHIAGNQIVVKGEGIRFICDLDYIEYVLIDQMKDGYNFDDLYLKQLELTKLSKQKAGIDEIPVDDLMMWLLAEAGEALNEAKFFKYFRNKEINREKLVEELVDCLFMFLELSILTDFTNTEYAKSFKDKDGCTIIDEIDDIALEFTYLMSEISLAIRKYKRGNDDYKRKLYDAMNTYVGILKYYEISNSEVHKMFYKKAKININRV